MSDPTPTSPTRPAPGVETPTAPTTTGEQSDPVAPAPGRRAARDDNPLRGSRTSGFWAAVVALGVVLVLLIVFIAQNTQQQDVTFLAWTGRAPMAVLLLIAAAAGLFLSAAAGSLRILQLRRRVKREVKRSR